MASIDDLPDECLARIFVCFSLDTGDYAHALVCRRWRSLAPASQVTVTVRKDRALSAHSLISCLLPFRNLTTLQLSPGSLQLLTDRLLLSISLHCPQLEHLLIHQQVAPVSCFNAPGLAALFSGCPRLRTCQLHSTCGDVLELPDSITTLHELDALEFGSWTGTYSWRTYPNLTSLPLSFGSLSHSLRSLTLVSRSLHALPPSFCALTGLRELNIHSVELGDLPPNLGNLSSLRSLRVRSQLLTSLPQSLGCLRALQHLCLNFCNCLLELPSSFGRLQGLQRLEIFNCYALLKLPASFSNLSLLQELTIHGCAHLVDLPEDLGALHNLRKLILKFARRLRKLPASVAELTSLEALEVNTCDQIEELPAKLGRLRNLKSLTLSGCRKITSLPASLQELTALESVEISECRSLKAVPASLKDLPSLTSCIVRDISGA